VHRTRLMILTSVFLLVTLTAFGQQSVDVASVSGRVTDPTGAVIPGASVTARQTETNVQTTAVTDQDGRFRFPYLRIGPYEVSVRRPGFQTLTRGLI
jgi:hypothetical protein